MRVVKIIAIDKCVLNHHQILNENTITKIQTK